jgi:hypothetical protein
VCPTHEYSIPKVLFVTFFTPFMALSRHLEIGFNAFPLWSQLLVFSTSDHDTSLFIHISPRYRTLLLYVDDMIITRDDPQYMAFVKTHLSDQFVMSDFGPLRYFL